MKKILFGALPTLALMAPGLASAQIEEIMVTAERRSESIQTVPVAVSAFNFDQLEMLQIDSAEDLGPSVPNLRTDESTANATAIQVHMRGASVQNPGFAVSESPVGIYQDGVYRGRLATSNLEFSDVERIEVMRGPQGSLYGRNTIAGAINIVSRTPDDDRWANGSIGYGKFETSKVKGSVGGPIQEGSMAASFAFSYGNRDGGYIYNAALDEDVGEFEDLAGRGKLHFYGNDNFDAVFTAWAFSSDNDGWSGIPFGPGFGAPGDDPSASFYPQITHESFYTQLTSFPSRGEADETGMALDMSYDIGDMTLRSITGYSDTDDEFDFDLSGGWALGFAGLIVESTSNVQQITQELQLLGNSLNGKLEWLTGLYYLSEEGESTYQVTIGVPLFFENTENETESFAVFGQATYDLSDRLALTGGARWTHEEKDFHYDLTHSLSNPLTAFSLDETYSQFSPKVTLDFQMNENILFYGGISTGYQSGGFQALCFGNPVCAARTFGPQDVISYEVGVKGDFLDNRLRVNATTFLAQYDDLQQTETLGFGFFLANVGEVDVFGIELEVTAEPTEGLTLFANLGYADENYKKLNPGSAAALSGADELPGLPEFSGRFGFEYARSATALNNWLHASLTAKFGADLAYSDEFFSTVDNTMLMDSSNRLNAFLSLGTDDGRWEFRFEGSNITGEKDTVSGIAGGGVNERTILPPSEWMAKIKFSF
jgi:iron complex outermembrane receptor protein